ncbi:hypothetical protein F8388_009862, partial [Cannabis sativa]
ERWVLFVLGVEKKRVAGRELTNGGEGERVRKAVGLWTMTEEDLRLESEKELHCEIEHKSKIISIGLSKLISCSSRDSSDPNYDDSPGSDRVFIRVDNNPYSVDTFFAGDNPDNVDDSNSIFDDAPEDYDAGEEGNRVFGSSSQSTAHPLPDRLRKEIVELGFPDDWIKNSGGGSAFYHNPKTKLEQLPKDIKAYDASRLKISEVKTDPNEEFVYSVASKTVGIKVKKAVDPEVAALLDDDSDASRFGSDVEDLEEDFCDPGKSSQRHR